MNTNADISNALKQLEEVKQAIDESGDTKLQMETAYDLKVVLDILHDPRIRDIVRIQDSIAELNNQIAQHPSILPNDFDISLSGELILKLPQSELFDPDFGEEQRVPSSPHSPHSPISMTKSSFIKNDFSDIDKPVDKVRKFCIFCGNLNSIKTCFYFRQYQC